VYCNTLLTNNNTSRGIFLNSTIMKFEMKLETVPYHEPVKRFFTDNVAPEICKVIIAPYSGLVVGIINYISLILCRHEPIALLTITSTSFKCLQCHCKRKIGKKAERRQKRFRFLRY